MIKKITLRPSKVIFCYDENMHPFILVITGPAGSGKSTTALRLAKEIKQCVNIDVDVVKHMIVNGFINPKVFRSGDYLVLTLVYLPRIFTMQGTTLLSMAISTNSRGKIFKSMSHLTIKYYCCRA